MFFFFCSGEEKESELWNDNLRKSKLLDKKLKLPFFIYSDAVIGFHIWLTRSNQNKNEKMFTICCRMSAVNAAINSRALKCSVSSWFWPLKAGRWTLNDCRWWWCTEMNLTLSNTGNEQLAKTLSYFPFCDSISVRHL